MHLDILVMLVIDRLVSTTLIANRYMSHYNDYNLST